MSKNKCIMKKSFVKPKTKPPSNPVRRPALFHCENKITPHNCKSCNFRTMSFLSLKKHIREYHTKPDVKNFPTVEYHTQIRYRCKKIDFVTYSSLKWLQHSMTCRDDRLRIFHTQMRIGMNWNECDKCNFKTPYHGVLERHKIGKHLKYDEIFWYDCDQCSYKSKLKTTLQRHKFLVHLKQGCPSQKRDHCDYVTKGGSAMRRQEAAKHKDVVDVPSFECVQCPFRATYKRHLETHIHDKHVFKSESHPNQLKHRDAVAVQLLSKRDTTHWFKCGQCSYQSERKGAVKAHKISKHSGSDRLSWYKCNLCEFEAQNEKYLENHVISRHLEGVGKGDGNDVFKCYRCDQCGYTSKHVSALHAHRISKHLKDADIQLPRFKKSCSVRKDTFLNDHTYAQRVNDSISTFENILN